MTDHNVAVIQGLTKRYGKYRALNDINLTLKRGRIIGLLGDNGAGKTTLIKVLAHMYQKNQGDVVIEGEPVSEKTHKWVSYLSDTCNLFDWMNPAELIRYGSELFPDFRMEKAEELCEMLQIDLKMKIRNMSKGYKERTMVMFTFSRETSLYLLDEPLGGIDPLAKKLLLQAIRAQSDERKTILVATHLVKDMEQLFDEVILMRTGKVLLHEETDQIRDKHQMSVDDYYQEVMQ